MRSWSRCGVSSVLDVSIPTHPQISIALEALRSLSRLTSSYSDQNLSPEEEEGGAAPLGVGLHFLVV